MLKSMEPLPEERTGPSSGSAIARWKPLNYL